MAEGSRNSVPPVNAERLSIQASTALRSYRPVSGSAGGKPRSFKRGRVSGNNPISGTIVKRDGTPLAAKNLSAGALIDVRADGSGKFRLRSVAPSDQANNIYVRTKLQGNLNLYVATTGSDSNPGTSASPFLTLQAATNVARGYDTNGFSITVNVANGTYSGSGAILASPLIGGGSLIFLGNPSSPSSVVVNNTASTGNTAAFDATGGGQIVVNGFTVSSTNGSGLFAQGAGSVVSYLNMVFANCINGYQVYAFGGAQALAQAGTCSIVGNAIDNLNAVQNGSIFNNGLTAVTTSGTQSFTQFAAAFLDGSIVFPGCTFSIASGTVSGGRFSVGAICEIYTAGGGANYFPGSTAGVTAALGYYG